jgi:Family of unknown function (DUF6459)
MPPSESSAVRLVKIPDAAPPYDCETHGAACPVAPAPVTITATGSAATAGPPAEVRPAATAVPVDGVSPAGAWSRQFAQVIVEILAGVRSPRQIVPMTTDRARAQIRCVAPLLASDRRPRIQRIMTSRPTPCVVEVAVVVSLGQRSRALALRFEHVAARQAVPGWPARPARWLCTAIEAG